jgi:hypothetical protein
MAINKNHEFEELNGVKCAIVEKNIPAARVEFLRPLLEYNQFTVVVVPVVPKAAPAPAVNETGEGVASEEPPAPALFTLGVTDVMFNATNAIFGRALKTTDRHVVTLAYWRQQEPVSHDEIPYFESGF